MALASARRKCTIYGDLWGNLQETRQLGLLGGMSSENPQLGAYPEFVLLLSLLFAFTATPLSWQRGKSLVPRFGPFGVPSLTSRSMSPGIFVFAHAVDSDLVFVHVLSTDFTDAEDRDVREAEWRRRVGGCAQRNLRAAQAREAGERSEP